MTIRFSRFRGRDTKAASTSIISICEDRDPANPFLNGYISFLKDKNEVLAGTLAKSKMEEATALASEADDDFNDAMGDFRAIVRAKAMVPALGSEYVSSKKVFNTIERNGGAIEDLPRHSQIDATDAIIKELASIEGENSLSNAGVVTLFEEVKEAHTELKEIEDKRQQIKVDETAFPAVSSVVREINPLLTKIYNHVNDYSEIGNDLYSTILKELNAKLEPIAVLVKARDSRE